MAAALDLRGKIPQAARAVVGGITLAGEATGSEFAGMQQRQAVEFAVLGHEQENETIDDAE